MLFSGEDPMNILLPAIDLAQDDLVAWRDVVRAIAAVRRRLEDADEDLNALYALGLELGFDTLDMAEAIGADELRNRLVGLARIPLEAPIGEFHAWIEAHPTVAVSRLSAP